MIFECRRDSQHYILVVCRVEEDSIFKIGQYPSLADLAEGDMKEYRGLLDEEDYEELHTAVRLYTFGIGIGACVYLRRIIERLIEQAHQGAMLKPGWDENAYKKDTRTVDKISLLKEALPSLLVENKNIYSILSKNIHEQSEEECLADFPALRAGINLILDEKLSEKNRRMKKDEFEKALSERASKMGKPR